MNIVKEKKRQYVYIKEAPSNGFFIFLTNQPKNTEDYRNTIIYDCQQDRFWFYKDYYSSIEYLTCEFDVLSKYKQEFDYKEDKYWQFINMVQKFRKENLDAYKD